MLTFSGSPNGVVRRTSPEVGNGVGQVVWDELAPVGCATRTRDSPRQIFVVMKVRSRRFAGSLSRGEQTNRGSLLMQVPETHSGPPPPSSGIVTAVAALVERLDDLSDVTAAAGAVAEFAVLHLGSDLAGLSQQDSNGRPVRLAARGGVLAELDAIEAALGAGPGTAPLLGDEVLSVADTRSDGRWPEWSSAAADQGVCSLCLVAMPPLRERALTLQLFWFHPGALRSDDLPVVAAVAKIAGLALRQVDRRTSLERAMVTRDLIGRAQGIVMERYALSSEQAMQFLRRSSQQSHGEDPAHRRANRH